MISRHPRTAAMLAASFAALALPATSAEWIADREIATYCNQYLTRPDSPSGTVCLSYIQGFLDGLRTTETPAQHELEYVNRDDEAAAREAEKVSAVRMNELVDEFGPPARAGICLPENFSEEEIRRVIARGVRHGMSSGRGALDDYAQAALQDRYPCDTSDPMAGEPVSNEPAHPGDAPDGFETDNAGDERLQSDDVSARGDERAQDDSGEGDVQ